MGKKILQSSLKTFPVMDKFFDIKYHKKNKYKTSSYTLKSSKDSASFINNIRQESCTRQIVMVDHKIVIFGVEGPILLPSGKLWSISAQVQDGKWGKHYIMVSPNIEMLISRGKSFLRLDSGCLSGIVFGDTTCDCLYQLRKAQNIVLKKGGIIIHIPEHDGRGWQEYKMANQRIMYETNLDTITVAKKFYGSEDKIDIRTFDESALILKALGFPKGYEFNLGTKNPKKVNALTRAGFNVSTNEIKMKRNSEILIRNLKAKDKFFKNQVEEESYA